MLSFSTLWWTFVVIPCWWVGFLLGPRRLLRCFSTFIPDGSIAGVSFLFLQGAQYGRLGTLTRFGGAFQLWLNRGDLGGRGRFFSVRGSGVEWPFSLELPSNQPPHCPPPSQTLSTTHCPYHPTPPTPPSNHRHSYYARPPPSHTTHSTRPQ